MHNPESVLENETYKNLWSFERQKNHLISARQPDLVITCKKKRSCRVVNLAVTTNSRMKLKEREKKDKYCDFAREMKRLWNVKVTVIPIVIGALGTVTKGLI